MFTNRIREIHNGFKTNLQYLLYPDAILAKWWTAKQDNWGDALNPVLISLISKKKTILDRYIINYRYKPIYMVCGSILQYCDKSVIEVWGPGFYLPTDKIGIKPKKVHAVRGPLTRNLLLKQGIECPEVYGDPALLYKNFYNPKIIKKYKLGIIPHFGDFNSPLVNQFKSYPEILLIDICGGINQVVDAICSCKYIASSSLHGLIIADMYGIPSRWIKFSDRKIGSDFKFGDYFLATKKENINPFILTNTIEIEDIIESMYPPRLEIDLDTLLEACPFLPD